MAECLRTGVQFPPPPPNLKTSLTAGFFMSAFYDGIGIFFGKTHNELMTHQWIY